ncbi:MAG: helix-turn-helix transcriptional regulator [bacterium]|nr:helix-turn-helix transcriptional regulator [bacterium]
MMIVDKEVDRCLTLLRNKIREKGFTQLQVQEALSWGRSYISQLLTKQKSLRVEQVLLILSVIGVDPAEFFAELYYPSGPMGFEGGGPFPLQQRGGADAAGDFEEMRSLVRSLVWLLIDKELIDVDELTSAVKSRKDEVTGFDTEDGPAN